MLINDMWTYIFLNIIYDKSSYVHICSVCCHVSFFVGYSGIPMIFWWNLVARLHRKLLASKVKLRAPTHQPHAAGVGVSVAFALLGKTMGSADMRDAPKSLWQVSDLLLRQIAAPPEKTLVSHDVLKWIDTTIQSYHDPFCPNFLGGSWCGWWFYMSNCGYLLWWKDDVAYSRVRGNVGFTCKTRSKRDGGTPKTR